MEIGLSTRLLDASVITGPIPVAIIVAALAAIGVLLARRNRSWWTRVVPGVVVGAVAGAALLGWIVDWWQPFPDPLPIRVIVWTGFAMLGLGLVGVTLWPRRPASRWRRVAAVPLLAVLLLLPMMKVNAFYGYFPTVGAAIGVPAWNVVDFAALPRSSAVDPAAGRPSVRTWVPPPGMPTTGAVAQVQIPGTVSGFPARAASVYLPPAYLTQNSPLLPVLVLIAGQPGGPQDWLTAGMLPAVMDRFAAAHHGLAPVVVIPDASGAPLANPLCMNSRLGNVETYLVQDVPDWIRANLQIEPDPRSFAVAGFSYGGTCALQLAVRAPHTYPTFLDISGQAEPSLGTHSQTVAATFAGDEAAFRAVNPIDILATTMFPGSAGIIAIGKDDPDYGPDARTVLAATRQAGMEMQSRIVAGGHSWQIATLVLDKAMPWIAARTGLVDSAP